MLCELRGSSPQPTPTDQNVDSCPRPQSTKEPRPSQLSLRAGGVPGWHIRRKYNLIHQDRCLQPSHPPSNPHLLLLEWVLLEPQMGSWTNGVAFQSSNSACTEPERGTEETKYRRQELKASSHCAAFTAASFGERRFPWAMVEDQCSTAGWWEGTGGRPALCESWSSSD